MDWTSLIGPAVVAAVISGLVSSIGIWISARTARRIHTDKIAFDERQAERRASADLTLAERKITADIALAEKKLALDRALAAWKRQTELAEETLADFYQARDIFQAARSPGGFGDEGDTRQKEEWETENDTRTLNSYFRTAERLAAKSEFFAQLASRLYRFTALFGADASEPYKQLFQIRSEILVAVRMLITTHRQRADGSLPQDRKGWESIIGWPHTEFDPIAARVDSVVEAMEKICRSVRAYPESCVRGPNPAQ
jgi:hypothetical protein